MFIDSGLKDRPPSPLSWIPNALSILRLCLAPWIGFAIAGGYHKLAIWILLLACFTDVADGFLARSLKCESLLGSYLDPTADKFFFLVLFASLFLYSYCVPGWLFFLVCFREGILMIGSWVLLWKRGIILSVNWGGKLTTCLQFLYAFAILATSNPSYIVEILKWSVVFVMTLSTLYYLYQGFYRLQYPVEPPLEKEFEKDL